MMHQWCCLTCGKQGRVGKAYKTLNNSLRTHTRNCHNGNTTFLVISEFGSERTIEIKPKEEKYYKPINVLGK